MRLGIRRTPPRTLPAFDDGTGLAPAAPSTLDEELAPRFLIVYAPLVAQPLAASEELAQVALAQVALSGTRITSHAGTLNPVISLAITGIRSTFHAGTIQPSSSIPLLGIHGVFTPGTLLPIGNVTAALTGTRATFTPGSLSVAPAASADAGSKHYRRALYYVRIDGQQFELPSLAAALKLLEDAKTLAKEEARKLVAAAVAEKGKPVLLPQLREPQMSASPYLKAAVAVTKREIDDIYRQARIDAQIRLLMELDRRADEDEDSILLLM
ncbi:MAG: hypothetical protein ACREDR_04820 [Blastocatellia bacterium]